MTLYGYGIVDKDDQPWWGDDWCVCGDRDTLEDELETLNDTFYDDPRAPYRIVELCFTKEGVE